MYEFALISDSANLDREVVALIVSGKHDDRRDWTGGGGYLDDKQGS